MPVNPGMALTGMGMKSTSAVWEWLGVSRGGNVDVVIGIPENCWYPPVGNQKRMVFGSTARNTLISQGSSPQMEGNGNV